jgi:hypothetical protein
MCSPTCTWHALKVASLNAYLGASWIENGERDSLSGVTGEECWDWFERGFRVIELKNQIYFLVERTSSDASEVFFAQINNSTH